MPQYLASKREKSVPRFHSAIAEEFFAVWPERQAIFPDISPEVALLPDQQASVNEAVVTQKRVSNLGPLC